MLFVFAICLKQIFLDTTEFGGHKNLGGTSQVATHCIVKERVLFGRMYP